MPHPTKLTLDAVSQLHIVAFAQVFADKGLVYTLLVRTGDVKNAGTDAKVFVQLFGDNGQTDRIPLATSAGHKNKFERGRTDTFTFEGSVLVALMDAMHCSQDECAHDN